MLVAVPNGDGWIHKHVAFAIMQMQGDKRYDLTFIMPTHRPIEQNLALIKRDFLAGGYDYLLSIDSDNPPTKNPLDLISLDKDVIGCVTPIWANMKKGDSPVYWNALMAVEGGWRPFAPDILTEPIEVDAIGGGCFIVARRVLEAITSPFQRIWNEDGTMHIGWDYAFCSKVQAAGFKVWAHFGYPCRHFNEIELTEVITAFDDLYHAQPASTDR